MSDFIRIQHVPADCIEQEKRKQLAQGYVYVDYEEEEPIYAIGSAAPIQELYTLIFERHQ